MFVTDSHCFDLCNFTDMLHLLLFISCNTFFLVAIKYSVTTFDDPSTVNIFAMSTLT